MLLSEHVPYLDEVCCVHCLDSHGSDFPPAKQQEPSQSMAAVHNLSSGRLHSLPLERQQRLPFSCLSKSDVRVWSEEETSLLRDRANRTFPLHGTALNVSTHGQISKGEFYLVMATGR